MYGATTAKYEKSGIFTALDEYEDDFNCFETQPSEKLVNYSNLKKPLILTIAASAIVAISILLYSGYNVSTNPIVVDKLPQFGSLEVFSNPTISVTNEYSTLNQEMFSYPFLNDAVLMEPHRENNVIVNIPDSFQTCPSSSSECSLTWSLEHNGVAMDTGIVTNCFNDVSFPITPTSTGQFSLKINSICQDGSTTDLGTFSTWVKYVRRELSTLTDNDRTEFLDALSTLWRVSTLDGQKLYGPNYKSLWYLATIHIDGGSSPVCDEFHGNHGYGFVSNHVFLGLYLEQSLQMVNPRVSLHYLEYAKDFSSNAFASHLINQFDGGSWTEIMTEKFFGSNSPQTGEILDGRWADVSIPYMNDEFFLKEGIDTTRTFFPVEESAWFRSISESHRSSPYGLLRSPWNYNPSTQITRFNNVNRVSFENVSSSAIGLYMGSQCKDYETFISSSVIGKPASNYLLSAEDMTHGNIHFAFGGSGGDHCVAIDNQLKSTFGFSDEDLVIIAQSAQKFMKSYGNAVFNGPIKPLALLNCSVNPWQNGNLDSNVAPGENGGPSCSCNADYFASEDLFQTLISGYFSQFVSSASGINVISYLMNKEVNFELRKTAMNMICGRMQFDGDMAGASAAVDPLFWVAHGAVEKLFQRVTFESLLTDSNYPRGSDLEYSNLCSGHRIDGKKFWLTGYYFEDKTVDASALSNKELFAVLNPTSNQYRDLIPYVYDDSSYSFCEDLEKLFQSSK